MIAAFCAGNATRIARFLRDGRGDYCAALSWLAAQSAKPRVTVTGSNDFALRHEIEFHGRDLPDGKTITYQSLRSLPRSGSEWLIVRREELDAEPADVVEDAYGNRYTLRRKVPSYGPSGAEWFLYARS